MQTFKACFSHDEKLWKLRKITRNDEDAYNDVKEVVIDFYQDLKEIFQVAAIQYGASLDFDMTSFRKFCKDAGILNKQLTSSVLDTYFKATNYEEIDQENNDDNAIIRFEFLEILVRIARGKYIDFGKDKRLDYSMTKLVQQHIMPMSSKLWHL